MGGVLADYRLFFQEFRRSFRATGSILPSGRSLAVALARFVGEGQPPRRILEVGPGTGAVTQHILQVMHPSDRVDLVEVNLDFVQHLRRRLLTDPAFRPRADRVTLMHLDVEELTTDEPYDVVISGLPLNNFSVEEVAAIVAALCRLGRVGGTLSFFEYIAIRTVRSLVSGRDQRVRLRKIGRILDRLVQQHEFDRDAIWFNVPPAWVHHVRIAPSDV